VRQRSEPDNWREKKGVRFLLARAEIWVIAVGAAKSVVGNEVVFGQQRKAHKRSKRGSLGVGCA